MPQLLFDLDGTISDPLEGIAKSINFALSTFGYKVYPLTDLSSYIGPPLYDTFKSLTGSTNDSEINEIIIRFRERYGQIGYSENTIYPGIESAIKTLNFHKFQMGICTSKRSDFADKILRMFDIRHYFQFISGGDIGINKNRQISSLLKDKTITNDALMIGDRATDLSAAKENNLRSIGVLWGYGSRSELETESPLLILTKTNELEELVKLQKA